LARERSGTPVRAQPLDDLLRAASDVEPPSVRFALESALVECWAAARGTSVAGVLGAKVDRLALNALIVEPAGDLEAQAERLRAAGYQAVKLKVGRTDVPTDAARVRTLRDVLGDEVDLRLDANRAWTREEAAAFADALGDVPLSYVEEPLRNPAGLAALVHETGLPVALDETTREKAPDALPDDLPLRAVVLKPTLLGGLSVARRWASWAHERDAVPVVSASYESGVGLRMLAALAASLSDAPAGLSTYARLESDVLRPRLRVGGAQVDVDRMYDAAVDQSALIPVDLSD
jgi:O-succinylbenzoate synthase